jgi:Na+/H+ antiporter NhaC
MMNQGDEFGEVMGAISDNSSKEEKEITPHVWAFVVPMVVVIIATLWLNDIFYGVTIGIFTCFVLFVPTKMMSLGKFADVCYKGLEDMLFIAAVLVTSLFYREAISLIGLPDYLIEAAGPYMSAAWLPAITFILVGLVCFATGNIWSIPAICTPIILPLAVATGASIPLTLGAIISAACFGAQACFYSDVTLLSASACKINNVDYAMAQLPYIGIVTAISFVAYVIAGFAMA